MSRSFWRIAVDTRDYQADDMFGTGAKITGGRWNEVGTAMIYTASTRALACLETLVHLNAGGLPLNRWLVEIVVPDDLWESAEVSTPATIGAGWDTEPASRTSIKIGSAWAKRESSALLVVPSVIVPEENNLLINPAHSHAAQIIARKIRRWLYDPRMSRRVKTP